MNSLRRLAAFLDAPDGPDAVAIGAALGLAFVLLLLVAHAFPEVP